jgi:hypothetical protein
MRLTDSNHPPMPTRGSRTTLFHVVPVVLVTGWGIGWMAAHASQHEFAHTLFQALALTESMIALLLRRRKPRGAFVGILVAYLASQLDAVLLPPLLIALFTVAASTERRTAVGATAATAIAVAALPLTGRTSGDVAGYLLPRILAVAMTAILGLWTRTASRDRVLRRFAPPLASSEAVERSGQRGGSLSGLRRGTP